MDYVQVLENRIRQMRQSFFELASHVEKAQITHRQPNRTYELQRIIRDFLSASQNIEPFGESQHNDGYAINDYPRSDPTPLNPVVSSNIYTSCQTNLPVPASVGPIETSMPIHASPFGNYLFFPDQEPQFRGLSPSGSISLASSGPTACSLIHTPMGLKLPACFSTRFITLTPAR